MEISAIIALIGFVEPYIVKAIQKGEISPADQAALKARVEALREAAAFQGPEWTLSDAATTPTTPPVVSTPAS
jgi:hypothetical protein